MSKQVLVIVAIIVVVGLAGTGWYMKSKSGAGTANTSDEGQQETGGVFGSIKDALSNSLSLKCEFKDEAGRTNTAYIKAGSVRTDFVGKTEAETGSIIMKANKMYFWNSQMGFTMDLSSEDLKADDDTVKPNGVMSPTTQSESLMTALEKYKDSCKPAVVSDALFAPPTDVTFTDFSQMMKNQGQ